MLANFVRGTGIFETVFAICYGKKMFKGRKKNNKVSDVDNRSGSVDSNIDSTAQSSKISSSFIFLDTQHEDEPRGALMSTATVMRSKQEARIKELMCQLQASRSAVQETICTDLQSAHFSADSSSELVEGPERRLNSGDVRTVDLEVAVLVQVVPTMTFYASLVTNM